MSTALPSDQAFGRFSELIGQADILGLADRELSETDTRTRFIDPIFTKVLDWRPLEIRQEVAAADGHADYSFGIDPTYFHVEAKRVVPKFQLHTPTKLRRYALTSTHLLKNPDVEKELRQTQKYAADLGTTFAVLTNGSQFLIFESMTVGRRWFDGQCIVFHSLEDIRDHFAEFWSLLSRESVTRGSLRAAFAVKKTTSYSYIRPLEQIHNQDAELIRNPYWQSISSIFYPLLTDQPENDQLQIDIIKNCYVMTPLASESADDLASLLRDMLPVFLQDAGVRHIDPGDRSEASFGSKLVYDLKLLKPGTYVLTGGVGSGKTSFLRRFAFVDKMAFIRDYCTWMHVDFLGFGATDVSAEAIESFFYDKVLGRIKTSYDRFLPTNGEELRKLFRDDIARLELSLLYGVEKNSDRYRDTVNQHVSEWESTLSRYVPALLMRIREGGKRLIFVLDNTDQQGEEFQRQVFLLAQKLADSHLTLAVVSLREEKFFAALGAGVFDAYGTRKFHIGSPSIRDMLRRRLNYGVTQLKAKASEELYNTSPSINIVTALIDSSLRQNGDIVQFLGSISGGDMRVALLMFRDFLSSGNTDIRKIDKYVNQRRIRYSVPFHEFLKSATLGARRYYNSAKSRVVNVFSISAADAASHWTACRILWRLMAERWNESPVGVGFVPTANILREYEEGFGNREDFIAVSNVLLSKGLLDAEPPRVADVLRSEWLRISATGAYYWNKLARSFAYMDLITVDTAIAEASLAKQIADSAQLAREDVGGRKAHMIMRISRVRDFLAYPIKMEEMEIATAGGDVWREPLGVEIRKAVEAEIAIVQRKMNITP